MEKKESIGFALKNITTEQFAIIEECFSSEAEIQLMTDIGFGLDKDKRVVKVQLKITYLSSDHPFIILETATYFLIKPESFESFFDEERTHLTLPAGFAQHMGVIAVGSARGILHAKTENTPFNKFLLPTINLVELVGENVKFTLLNEKI